MDPNTKKGTVQKSTQITGLRKKKIKVAHDMTKKQREEHKKNASRSEGENITRQVGKLDLPSQGPWNSYIAKIKKDQ